MSDSRRWSVVAGRACEVFRRGLFVLKDRGDAPPDGVGTAARSEEESSSQLVEVAPPAESWPGPFRIAETVEGLVEVTCLACSKGDELSEDALAVSASRVAVADGASSAWEAGRWAQSLVDAWVQVAEPEASWLTSAKERFDHETPAASEDLGWLQDAAASRGAHAAFLGVELTVDGGHAEWLATAVGDVTAVLVAAGEVLEVFPNPDGHGFGSHPPLLSNLDQARPDFEEHRSTLAYRQALLVMSDAVAEFVLKTATSAEIRVLSMGRANEIVDLLDRASQAGSLTRDDLTLVRLRLRKNAGDRTG